MSPGLTSTLAEMSPRLIRSFSRTLYWLAAFRGPQDGCLVAVGKVGEPADDDHQVQHRHALPIRERLRLRGLADDADLLRIGTDEPRDDHGDDRVADVLRQRLFDVARQRGRVLAERRQVLDERRRDLSVGPHRDASCESSGLRQTTTLTLSPGPIL